MKKGKGFPITIVSRHTMLESSGTEKEKQRRQIEKDTADFIKKKGEVEKIPSGVGYETYETLTEKQKSKMLKNPI